MPNETKPTIILLKSTLHRAPVKVGGSVDMRGHTRRPHTRNQMVKDMSTSSRFDEALHMATLAHAGQVRKGAKDAQGNPVPYITHPAAVAALVRRYGGDEDQAIAGLLHDVLEDAGHHWAPKIKAKFGGRVLSIVEACTDGTPDASGKKAPWIERKTAYLQHLSAEPDDALLVSACDKLHNVTAIRKDQEEIGDKIFDRFSSTKSQTLWYYDSLAHVFEQRKVAPAPDIRREFNLILSRVQK